MRSRFARYAAVLALALLMPLVPGQAAHASEINGDGWCYVMGQVQGLGDRLECFYVAKGPTQSVYVATLYPWEVVVLRDVWDETYQEWVEDFVVLAEGVGPVAGPPPKVHPHVGETVYVRMYAGCLPPADFPCGSKGIVGAGLEYGGEHDVLGFPVDVPALTSGDAEVAGLCRIDGTNYYDPSLTGTAETRQVTSKAWLEACVSDDVNGPAAGTRSMGTLRVSGGTEAEPWLWQEPVGTLSGNCTGTTVVGTYIVDWEDGTTTVLEQQTTSNTWAIRSEGEVVSSVTLTAVDQKPEQPDTLTLESTRYVGHAVSAAKVSTVNTDDPLECTDSGLPAAHRSGTYSFLAG